MTIMTIMGHENLSRRRVTTPEPGENNLDPERYGGRRDINHPSFSVSH